jgi:hypothetical protein
LFNQITYLTIETLLKLSNLFSKLQTLNIEC